MLEAIGLSVSHLVAFGGGCAFWHFVGGKVWGWVKSKV